MIQFDWYFWKPPTRHFPDIFSQNFLHESVYSSKALLLASAGVFVFHYVATWLQFPTNKLDHGVDSLTAKPL